VAVGVGVARGDACVVGVTVGAAGVGREEVSVVAVGVGVTRGDACVVGVAVGTGDGSPGATDVGVAAGVMAGVEVGWQAVSSSRPTSAIKNKDT
jgi:hypothetical protein